MYNEYSERKQNYYGAITAMDDQIGRLQSLLENLQVDDKTIIWFCSDNGPVPLSRPMIAYSLP